MRSAFIVIMLTGINLCACAHAATVNTGYGPDPAIPAPDKHLIPTFNIAPATGWEENQTPVPAEGFSVNAFAAGLDHPRWLYVLPNGDVLVAESDAPEKEEKKFSLKGAVMGAVMKHAGSHEGSPDRILLLRDTDGDGVSDQRSVFMDGLRSPFGMALVGGRFYVANTDALLSVPYRTGQTRITARPTKLTDLPAFPIDHHWTKGLRASKDGSSFFVSVGSNSNVGENGLDKEKNRAAILQVDRASGEWNIYASGLRNPVGMDLQPETGELWTVVNERDELGDNLVPDYLTSVKPGGFYGWPFSYWGQHVEQRIDEKNRRPDLVAQAIVPDYGLGNHTAPLGLAFYKSDLFPAHYRGGAFVAQHGSWNRKPKSGYRVIFIPFAGGKPSGMPEKILGGFLDREENARGRPVGLAVDAKGALLVADDVGNAIWRVTPSVKHNGR